MSEKWLEEQANNYKRYEVVEYFSNLLNKRPKKSSKTSRDYQILELGAGSGVLTNFLAQCKIIKLDIIMMPEIDVQADIYKIPIKNEVIDEIILVDVFHHLGKPWIFFDECFRILKKNGTMTLIEPYRSIFSYPVFKLFHHEPMLLTKKYYIGVPILNDNPTSADNGIPKNIFINKKNKKILNEMINRKFKIESEIKFSDFLSFFATGGLHRSKSIIRGQVFRYLLIVENFLPQPFLRLFGSRMIVTLSKDEN